MVTEDLGNTRNKYYTLVKELESLQRWFMMSGFESGGPIDCEKYEEGDWIKWKDIEKLIK